MQDSWRFHNNNNNNNNKDDILTKCFHMEKLKFEKLFDLLLSKDWQNLNYFPIANNESEPVVLI